MSRAIVTAGNLVDSSTLLTTVVSDSPVYAYFDIDEQTYLEHVRGADARSHGSIVHVGLINEHGYPHAARLDFLDNQVDPDHGTIRARAVLDNADGRFTPGLFVRLKLVSPRSFRAALVDDRAIGTDLGRKFVFVVDRAKRRAVPLGGDRQVRRGLARRQERPRRRRRRDRQRPAARSSRRARERDASRDGSRLARRPRAPAAANNDNLPLAHNVR